MSAVKASSRANLLTFSKRILDSMREWLAYANAFFNFHMISRHIKT
jgi:hypothetical protein